MSTQRSVDLEHIREAIAIALAEDVGTGDVTAGLCESKPAVARLICREHAILCGQQWFEETFAQLDNAIEIEWMYEDADFIQSGETVCTVSGNAPHILTGERTALNFIQTLSGTASITYRYMQKLQGTGTRLLDTRKTIPGLRYAQKYAVLCGGGSNHRMGLYDAYLIKENHIAACGSIADAVSRARSSHPELTIEIEVETLNQLREAIDCQAHIALLDNFSLEQVASAITVANRQIKLEVSGSVGIDNVGDYAALGVDYISVGALTKHVHAIDFSILLE